MGTHCYIAEEKDNDMYRSIYCHLDGYPEEVGKLLVKYYDTTEKLRELLALGDVYCLQKKLNPDPSALHYLYGKDVSQNMEAAVRWLTASAEHGNQYAAQLLHSVRNNKNLSVAMASLRLLHHISRMIQNRLEDERRGKGGTIIERKLRRQIEEKKQALGIRL